MKHSKPAWFRQVPPLGLFLSFSVFAACDDDGTGPTGADVDPDVAAAALDSVVQDFFDDNASVEVTNGPLGGFITAITGQQPLASSSFAVTSSGPTRGGLSGTAQGLRSVLRSLTSPAEPFASVAIPSSLVGATCIWNFDTVSPGWADDISRRGLCGTGNCIRFALYPIGVNGLPASQTESGYIDITDATTVGGAGFNIDVSILSEVDAVTLLDYGVSGTLSETTLNLVMSGSVSDGTNQLPLGFTIGGSTSSFSTGYTVTIGGFEVNLTFTSDESTGFGYVLSVVDLAEDDETQIIVGIDLQGAITPDSRITFNGRTIATLSGSGDSVTITAAEGSGLTEQQLFAFASLFDGVEGLFTELAGLFAFAMANTRNPVIIQ